MADAEDFNPYSGRGGTAFKYVCETCDLPFAQSFAFHTSEYHDGEPQPTHTYTGHGSVADVEESENE